MAMLGREQPGFVPSGEPIWGEQSPIECLDGCRCHPDQSRHKVVDLCRCKPDYVCAMHVMQEELMRPYPTAGFFEHDPLFWEKP